MRGVSETEEFLERLFLPFSLLLQCVSRWKVFRQLARFLAFLSRPFRAVWCRFWGYIFADEMPSRLGIAQRASYQRAYIPAYLMIGVCVLVVIFGIRSGEPTMVTITNARQPVTVVDMYVLNKAKATDSDLFPGAKQNVPRLVQQGSGFLGFVDLWSSSQSLSEPATTIPSAIYSLDPSAEFSDNDPISYSPVKGDGDTIVIPVDADYVWTETPKESPEPVNHGPLLIYKVRPKVPPSAKMMGIGGYVEVLVLIDPDGNQADFSVHTEDSINTYPEFLLDVILKDGTKAKLEFYIDMQQNDLRYVTIMEEPKEFKFADYFLEVLPEWRFGPAIRNSEPVHAFVRIRFNFCLPDDKDCVESIILQT